VATLNLRLLVLEQSSKSRSYPNGLGCWAAVSGVGGLDALVERLDNGTATDEDRAIIASIRGGERWVRVAKTELDRFYGESSDD